MQTDDTALVTVVIPTFNRSEGLRAAVKSVTDQSVPGLIIHIYDNCSTDSTASVVRELMAVHANIAYTRRHTNLGSLRNYSDAIKSVKTPYFIPLADDDWFLPGSIQLLLDTIIDDPSLGAVISQTLHQDTSGVTVAINPGRDWKFRKYLPEEMIPLWVQHGHFEWSSIIFSRKYVNASNVPDISTNLSWDVDLQLQLFSRSPVKLIEYPSAVFFLHPDQSFRSITISKFRGELAMLLKANILAQTAPENVRKSIAEFRTRWISRMATEIAYSSGIKMFILILPRLITDAQLSDLPVPFAKRWIHMKLRILRSKMNSKPSVVRP